MIDRKCFTEKELVGYEKMDEGGKKLTPTYEYFAELYKTRMAFVEYFGAHINYESAVSMN